MEEITYQKIEIFDILSKIGGLYNLLTTFISFFSVTIFTMYVVHLSKKYSKITEEEQNK